METATLSCPACWETIELVVDTSAGSAEYTEDCPVCCRPMRVRLEVDFRGEWSLRVESES